MVCDSGIPIPFLVRMSPKPLEKLTKLTVIVLRVIGQYKLVKVGVYKNV